MSGSPQGRVLPGASAHYQHADHYHDRYAARSEDRDFYLRAARGGQQVLEHGAGTGRLTLPLVQAGATVTALDVSAGMLDELRSRSAELPASLRRRLQVKLADMRSYRDRKKYDLVIAGFHTVCHLYSFDDVRAFLKRSFAQLHPGGRLLFDVPMPRTDMEGYDPIAQVRVTHMDGPEGPELLTQRFFQPQEMLMHLHYAGFRPAKVTADFTAAPVDRDTDILVFEGRRPC